MRKLVLPLFVVGSLVTSTAWAQEAGDDSRPRARAKGPRGQRGPSDPLMDLDTLSKQLNLDQNQRTQIQPLVEQYAEAVKQIHDSTPQDVRDKRRALSQEMREAKRAKDREKVKELNKQMRDLLKDSPQTAELAKLRNELIPQIEDVLRDDQKQAFQKLTKRAGQGGPGLYDPRFLDECVMQLDLRDNQKTELKKINQEFRDAMKALGKGAAPEKRREMAQQYHDEVYKVLDATQRQQLEEIAKKAPPPGMQALARNPRLLEQALETIQLRADQQTNIDALKERHRADVQAAGKDKKARAELNRKLLNDVVSQLDDAQKKELAKFKPPKDAGGKPRKRDKQS